MIATTIKEDVTQFFLNDENSRLVPGKKDSKTFKKVKKQKRYLNETMLSLHKKFINTASYVISYAQFCRLRPSKNPMKEIRVSARYMQTQILLYPLSTETKS